MKMPWADDETRALWAVGFIEAIDFVFLAVLFLGLMTVGFWCIFGSPTAVGLLTAALFMVVLLQLWILLLVYRCMRFVVQARADINMMPENAARLAQIFQAGGTPIKTST